MTTAEIRAFNQGVAAVIALAQASADAITARLVEKPTRFNFAAGALQALADEGETLLMLLPTSIPTVPIPVRVALPAPSLSAPIPAARKRFEARAQGYTGEACTDCGNFTLTQNGTCLKCDTCGATSGCS